MENFKKRLISYFKHIEDISKLFVDIKFELMAETFEINNQNNWLWYFSIYSTKIRSV